MNLDTKKQTRKYKIKQLARMKYGFLVILLCAIFLPSYTKLEDTGTNTYNVYLNGEYVGKLGDEDAAEKCLIQARRMVASKADDLVLVDTKIELVPYEEAFGHNDDEKTVTSAMAAILKGNIKETMARSYTLKIGQYSINLSSTDNVIRLLQAALDKYQDREGYVPVLNLDENRELSVLTASVVKGEDVIDEESYDIRKDGSIGIFAFLEERLAEVAPTGELDFDDYDQGLISMSFADDIEVVECYLPVNKIMDIEDAIEEVTQDKAVPTIYEVVSGDTLSQISERVNIPMDDLIAMNDSLENEFSVLQIGQELTITVPKPKLSVRRTEQLYFEEDYEAEIVYVPNDDWYTTDTKTLQEPSAGHHNVMAEITYKNDDTESIEYLKEEVTYEAVAKIVEKGTKIPPTYIRPISGGRQTSGFGRRKRPTAGASSYHKGVDWAVATGTPVYASSGGVVTRAGWGKGYGYCVYIKHPDGKETRYGHLSKVLVSAGQSVSQGQRIALSGNTGVSTGPHLHFEILVNGSQVNPLNYLK